MKTSTKSLAALLAAASVAVLLAPLPALAGEATASGGGKMFEGPGLDFNEVGQVSDGGIYEVKLCTQDLDWCQIIDNDGTEGWLPGGNLVGSAAKIEARQWNLTAKNFWNPLE